MPKEYIIVCPCYNEEMVIAHFLDELEDKLYAIDSNFVVVVVDDASSDGSLDVLKNYNFRSDKFILRLIRMNFNMGHQESIRQGLIYAHRISNSANGIIVMDSDGEDDPKAIIELSKIDSFDIVQVTRGKRQETIKFKLGYFLYKLLFRVLTGNKISFGNYSLISFDVLNSVIKQKFFHYSAFLSKQKFTITSIRYDRQKRLDGNSKMNYQRLIFHGLYSLIEYSEEVLYFMMKAFLILLFFLVGIIGYVLYSKFISQEAIQGWASSVGSSLVITCLIIVSTIIVGLLLLSIKKLIVLNQTAESYEQIR
ncbi:glycosyltransferase [Reichenbachiella sp.]|uniref:glycosyltransferase n=1 Tax=Reichenbachiella sp. TaxID=2184521 RepID=UPI003BB05E0E